MKKKMVLIDGHSILNRAFYGVPDLTNSKGLHTNAVYGFLNILFKILEEEQAGYLAVAFDVHAPTFRHIMYEDYKGTRKPMPQELREQVPVMKEVLKAMGIQIIEQAGYEADDILGTLAKKAEKEEYEVSLVSGDRDLLQIASERIKIRIPKTKRGGTEIEDYNTAQVLEKYHVQPVQIIELKALMGDTADNIPGIPGVGEKRATSIIETFGTVENAYEHIEEVTPPRARESLREHYEDALLSKKLATIKTDVPITCSLDEMRIGDLFTQEAFDWMTQLEFKSMLTRFDKGFTQHVDVEASFCVVQTQAEANEIFAKIEAADTMVVGCSVLQEEKSNCERYDEGGEAEFYGYALAFDKHAYVFFDDRMEEKDYLLTQLSVVLKKHIMAVFHLKDRLRVLSEVPYENIRDVSVAAYLLNPLKDTYLYEDIARDYLDRTVPSYAELFGKKKWNDVYREQREECGKYACYESQIAQLAWPVLEMQLEETNMKPLFEEIEMPLVQTLYDMERRGIRAHREELVQYGTRLQKRIEELEQSIYELAGETFNINSPKQLGVILFEKMHMPFAKKTKTGYSTSADILEKLRSEDPIIGQILEYRQLTKLKSTYADGLVNYISINDNRIHGTFNQMVTATGRISSTEPNLQNIPVRMELGREIRKVFVPKEGYVFLDADYSQIELRILAHMSGDSTLIEAYREAQDIHKITASQVFHVPLEEVTPVHRSNAKAVNFGIVYGISSFGLGQDLNISKKEAEAYIKKYFETYPQIKAFLDGLVADGREKGYVETIFGRRRPVPELHASNFMQRSFGERIAMNSPIQGTAADIIKIAMIRVNERLKQQKLRSALLLQVHDELLIETHVDEIEQVQSILEEEMFHAAQLQVPLEVEVKKGNSWYEAK